MTSYEHARSMSHSEIAAMLDEKASLKARVDELQQQLDWFKRQLFGEKSERQLYPDPAWQLTLGEGTLEPPAPIDLAPAPTAIAAHTRRKKRSDDDVLAEGLRFDASVPMTVIELVDADMDGIPVDDLALVDEKRTYRLAQRPAAYEIVCYARKTYKHRKTGEFFCAPAPESVLERSCADVSLLAGLLVE